MEYSTFPRTLPCRYPPFAYIFLENLLNLFLMVFICGTDEFVIGCVHQIPDALDLTGYVINEFLRCNTCFFCFQLNLLAMLVSSSLEKIRRSPAVFL